MNLLQRPVFLVDREIQAGTSGRWFAIQYGNHGYVDEGGKTDRRWWGDTNSAETTDQQ